MRQKMHFLLLSQKQKDKYVRFELTLVASDGTVYKPVPSRVTPKIEYTANLLNNGAFSETGTKPELRRWQEKRSFMWQKAKTVFILQWIRNRLTTPLSETEKVFCRTQ